MTVKIAHKELNFISFSLRGLAKASLLLIIGCQGQMPVHRDTQLLMGTYVEVVSQDSRAARIVFDEVKRIEKLLSKYDPDSEVSRLNKTGTVTAGPDLYYLLTRSKEFWFATDGAFDITVGPLMDIWGFTTKNFRQPADDEIRAVLSRVGMNKIIFHPPDNVVEFTVRGSAIDVGGLGKGYAVDCAVGLLRAAGVRSCLINAGGQIYCLGTNAGKPWRVAVRDPRSRTLRGSFGLVDKAVATSGDYEQFFIAGGRRFSHIMDPRTGRPSNSGVISATVIADDGLTADFLATALVVMGKEKGKALLERYPGAEAKVVEGR